MLTSRFSCHVSSAKPLGRKKRAPPAAQWVACVHHMKSHYPASPAHAHFERHTGEKNPVRRRCKHPPQLPPSAMRADCGNSLLKRKGTASKPCSASLLRCRPLKTAQAGKAANTPAPAALHPHARGLMTRAQACTTRKHCSPSCSALLRPWRNSAQKLAQVKLQTAPAASLDTALFVM